MCFITHTHTQYEYIFYNWPIPGLEQTDTNLALHGFVMHPGVPWRHGRAWLGSAT